VPDAAVLVRPARPADVAEVLRLIHALAEYERAPREVVTTEADLDTALFADPPAAGALVAEQDGSLVGMALYFRTFSTWTGRQGLHLEDLFVVPAARKRGVGRALFAGLADLCADQQLARLEWAVLSWNELALGFYRGLGAQPLEDWRTWRLSGSALAALAPPQRGGPGAGPGTGTASGG
jgi:GNAT superfamily N-acetyltransferase